LHVDITHMDAKTYHLNNSRVTWAYPMTPPAQVAWPVE
jgi:hypothetical protein